MTKKQSIATDDVYVAIMAGGGGTRLWPLSRRSQPKHVLPLFNGKSLYELTLDRLEGLVPRDHILVITSSLQKAMLRKLDKRLSRHNFIVEPQPKGTASVAAVASYAAKSINPEAVLAVLPSDHMISSTTKFQEHFVSACEVARNNHLVTLGIQPAYPATGYGYIQQGKSMGQFSNKAAFLIKQFREKPTLRDAEKMLKAGNYYWNSGMFFWKAKQFIHEFDVHMPVQSKIISEISNKWSGRARFDLDKNDWSKLIPETVDYGVMEKSRNAAILPAEGLGWNDLGSWESFFEIENIELNANIILKGKTVSRESKRVLVYSDNSDKLISLIGVSDLVVVDTKNVLLVCRKQDSQKIKEIVKTLQESNEKDYL